MGVITIMIFKFVLFTILFALAYAIKGGQGKYIFPNWERENPLSNKLTSTLIVFITVAFVTVFLQVNIGVGQLAWHSVGLFALGWLLSIAPSLGEEYGAIMARPDKYGEWMPQIKSIRIFGRKFQWVEGHMYGLKKAVQRGVWIGACMTAVTGYVPFIYFSLAFVPLADLCLNYTPKKIFDPWGWSEIAIGAICYGVPFSMMLEGL